MTKINKFASLLHDVFQPDPGPVLAQAAAKSLGRLVVQGGALTAEVVEKEAST